MPGGVWLHWMVINKDRGAVMKKKGFIMSILFIVLVCALWPAGNHDSTGLSRKVQLTKGKTFGLGEIKLQADYRDLQGAKLYAASIGMKEGYEIGKSYPVSGLGECVVNIKKDGGTHKVVTARPSGKGSLYPFMNLDLYVQKGSKREPIENFGARVTVSISYNLLKKVNKAREGADQIIFVFNDKQQIWLSINDYRSGIKGIRRFSDRIEFTIVQWPVNDRLIACGP